MVIVWAVVDELEFVLCSCQRVGINKDVRRH